MKYFCYYIPTYSFPDFRLPPFVSFGILVLLAMTSQAGTKKGVACFCRQRGSSKTQAEKKQKNAVKSLVGNFTAQK